MKRQKKYNFTQDTYFTFFLKLLGVEIHTSDTKWIQTNKQTFVATFT